MATRSEVIVPFGHPESVLVIEIRQDIVDLAGVVAYDALAFFVILHGLRVFARGEQKLARETVAAGIP